MTNLWQAAESAKRGESHGFIGFFPAGERECHWHDPHFGFFFMEGVEGLLRATDLDQMYPDLVVELT